MNEEKIKEVVSNVSAEGEQALKELLTRVTHLEEKVKERKNKFFLKSKTIIVNAAVATLSFAGILVETFGGLINTHLEYIKTVIPSDKVFLLFIALAAFNIYKRFGTKDQVVIKKKDGENVEDN